MVIKFSARYKLELRSVYDFIAKDSPDRAGEFCELVTKKLDNLLVFPHVGRMRADGAREFIFRGYVVPYLVENDEIIVLGIYKSNQWKY